MNRKCRALLEQRQSPKSSLRKYAGGGMPQADVGQQLIDAANNTTGWRDWEKNRPDYKNIVEGVTAAEKALKDEQARGKALRTGWTSNQAAIDANNAALASKEPVKRSAINYDQMRARLQAKQAGQRAPRFDNRDAGMQKQIAQRQAQLNSQQNSKMNTYAAKQDINKAALDRANQIRDVYHTIDQEMSNQKIDELNNRSVWDTMMDNDIAHAVLSPLNTVTGGLFEKAANVGDSLGHGRIGDALSQGVDLASVAGQLATNPLSTVGSNVAGAALQHFMPQQQPQMKRGGSVPMKPKMRRRK